MLNTSSKILSIILACEHLILFTIDMILIADQHKLNMTSGLIIVNFVVMSFIIQSRICSAMTRKFSFASDITAKKFRYGVGWDILKVYFILFAVYCATFILFLIILLVVISFSPIEMYLYDEDDLIWELAWVNINIYNLLSSLAILVVNFFCTFFFVALRLIY